jgi:hypothetical protein
LDLTSQDLERGNETDDPDEMPKPHIVTICEELKTVVSVRRNWKEGDNTYKRIEFFVECQFLPGFGLYSIGLFALVGSNSMVLTRIIRQLIDAGTLKNFPGGIKAKSFRAEKNNINPMLGEFQEVETGGQPLSEGIMLMPYQEPSQVLAGLRGELKTETLDLLAAAEQQLPETGGDAPVGTTLSLLEVSSRLQSVALMSMHCSQAYEFQLLFDLFAKTLPDEPYPFKVPGDESMIMRSDFDGSVNIVPISDPNVLTSTHRLLKAEALLKLAQSNPEMHNLREA